MNKYIKTSILMFIIASIIGFLILFDYGIFIRRPEEKLIESNEGFMIFPKYIAVDKEKNIYINASGKINVYYSNGKFKKAYKIEATSNGWFFTINKDNHLVISKREGTYVYDLDGNYIETMESGSGDKLFLGLKDNGKIVSTESGNIYILSSFIGNTKVIEKNAFGNKRLVYKISTSQYIIKIFLFFLVAVYIITLFTLFIVGKIKEISTL